MRYRNKKIYWKTPKWEKERINKFFSVNETLEPVSEIVLVKIGKNKFINQNKFQRIQKKNPQFLEHKKLKRDLKQLYEERNNIDQIIKSKKYVYRRSDVIFNELPEKKEKTLIIAKTFLKETY